MPLLQRNSQLHLFSVISFFCATSCFATGPSIAIDSFKVPTLNAGVTSLGAGSSGDMWFVEYEQDKIGKISTSGTITEFVIPPESGLGLPTSIIKGPDGRMWFTTEFDGLGAVTPDGKFQRYKSLSDNQSLVPGIAVGSDNRIYFPEDKANKIGAITMAGVASEYSLPSGVWDPWTIATGPDGNIWYTELEGIEGKIGNRVGRMTTTGVFTEFPLPTDNSLPSAITAGPDGNVWFVESRCPACGPDTGGQGETIGRITPSGVITEFEVPGMHGKDPGILHEGIVAGPDGALWFTESSINRVGRISTTGEISEFDLPASGAKAQSIALSSDGYLWAGTIGGDYDYLYKISVSAGPGIASGLTGSWFDPQQSGHGFNLEELSGNKLAVYWYTFSDSGEMSWISALGKVDASGATLDAYQIAGPGAKFPPNFDAGKVQPQKWGTLTFTFQDCNHGKVSWDTSQSGYSNGSMDLTRLTQPVGVSCP